MSPLFFGALRHLSWVLHRSSRAWVGLCVQCYIHVSVLSCRISQCIMFYMCHCIRMFFSNQLIILTCELHHVARYENIPNCKLPTVLQCT